MSMKWAVTRPNYFLLLIVFLAGVSCDAAPARDKTIYANTSNKELKQKALQLVKSIRDLMHSYNKKDRELMDEYRKKDQRDHWIQESGALLDSALRSYKENYSADAILLRNELSKRLPPQPNQKDGAILYQNPTNVLGLGLVADHLELIAKSLPDS